MLTDIFAIRYEDTSIIDEFSERERRFLVQSAKLIKEQLTPLFVQEERSTSSEAILTSAHDKVCMELALEALSPRYFDEVVPGAAGLKYTRTSENNIEDSIYKYLTISFEETSDPNEFLRRRLSVIELVFRETHADILKQSLGLERLFAGDAPNIPPGMKDQAAAFFSSQIGENLRSKLIARKENYSSSVHELNTRFRQAKLPLQYHNGFIHLSRDEQLDAQIERPFWNLVSTPEWANVDHDMKEAIDLRDNGGRDPAFYSARALESTLKIVSDRKKASTGKERGAKNYIDNLKSERANHLIAAWEAAAIEDFFRHVRNPLGHGPGSGDMPNLTQCQTDWAIANCMSWIRSLITRI